MGLVSFHSLFSFFAACVLAGYPPLVHDTTIVQVPGSEGVSISYKETTISSLADTLPVESYNISMFFWYFPARQQSGNAQTAIYLAGGPGQSSMYGAVQGGGPCSILPDSNSTQNNPYSWNEYVNMLYVDQPVGTGFSYDNLLNSTIDLLGRYGILSFDTYESQVPAENQTFLYGTFPSQTFDRTAPNSAIAARTLWHFSQAILAASSGSMPQTAFEIFTRAMLNLDIATGKKTTMGIANNYSSQGPRSSFGWKNELPIPPPVNCNLYNVQGSCTLEQMNALRDGTAEVVDFNVI